MNQQSNEYPYGNLTDVRSATENIPLITNISAEIK